MFFFRVTLYHHGRLVSSLYGEYVVPNVFSFRVLFYGLIDSLNYHIIS